MANVDVAVDLDDILGLPGEVPLRGGRHDALNHIQNVGLNNADAPLGNFVADDMFDLFLEQQFQPTPSPPLHQYPPPAPDANEMDRKGKQPERNATVDAIDLTANDDDRFAVNIELPPAAGPSTFLAEPTFTEDTCLAQVLQVLPDISHDHVLELYRTAPPADDVAHDWIQTFIGSILENGKYPTQKEVLRGTKRKREEEEDDWTKYEKAEGKVLAADKYKLIGSRLLKDEFPTTRYTHIQKVFKKHGSVFKAYPELVDDVAAGRGQLSISRVKTSKRGATSPIASTPPPLDQDSEEAKDYHRAHNEFNAARRKKQRDDERRRKLDEETRAEEENELLAQQEGTMQECGCCCSEYPMNRMVMCENPVAAEPHWLCWNCVKTHVETEIGQSRHTIVCFHVDGCTFGFSHGQLKLAVPEQQLEKLAKLEQEDAIRLAELDDLEECPFCDYKAICPPKNIDKLFRCGNSKCERVSCRSCKEDEHTPLSCEEKAKEKGVDARHAVEEAMTAALVRNCNQCKTPFTKDFGCNKMSCTKCRNLQCYVCGQNVKDYTHFNGQGGDAHNKCPLHDNTDQRHQDEVAKAEQEALKKVREENPNLEDDDLKIKVSEEVKRAEQNNIRRHDPYGIPLGPPPPLPLQLGRNDEYEEQLRLLELRNRERRRMQEAHEAQARANAAAMQQARLPRPRPGPRMLGEIDDLQFVDDYLAAREQRAQRMQHELNQNNHLARQQLQIEHQRMAMAAARPRPPPPMMPGNQVQHHFHHWMPPGLGHVVARPAVAPPAPQMPQAQHPPPPPGLARRPNMGEDVRRHRGHGGF